MEKKKLELKMKSTILIFTFIITILSCSSEKKSESVAKELNPVITEINTFSNVDSLDLNLCDKISIELTGLYKIIDTLESNINESTLSGKYLESEGFVNTTAGIGNWDKGPRMLHVKYERDSCFCDVYKKYYYNEMNSDGSYNLRITERIICNTEMYLDE